MAEQEIDESLMKADRYSKLIALFFSIGMYLLSLLLLEDQLFGASVAALGGIGVRFYIPYHASVFRSDAGPVRNFEWTGNYHHGAVGGGLVVGSILAMAVMYVTAAYWTAMTAGAVVATGSYLILKFQLS